MSLLAPDAVTIELATGRIDIAVTRADWPLDALCDFAARDNPRRAFLVVSKVLGRHVPTRPSLMRETFRDLAGRVPAALAGPMLVVGLAETAICLGQGVHEELIRRTGRDDILFLPSTRQRLDHPLLATFEEPHSHAARHLVYRPADRRFTMARTLVLVDDEVSTGTTLANAAAAFVDAVPTLDRIVVLSLTDWSNGTVVHAMPRLATAHSLLSGTLRWTGHAPVPPAEPSAFAFAFAAQSLGEMKCPHNYGRTGRADVADERDAIEHGLVPGAAVRIVGTCEFTYPPFRLAERLEAAGHDVVVQSTTRSPASIGGAMTSRLQFADNYGTGVANFLYNADPDDGRQTLICHETPPGSVDRTLLGALDARALDFGDTSSCG